ncbi:type VII secretion integral membrane protein EccD [Nocardia sp. 2]|uniref:Type VII secretion integral membrane protein EccD n=1 Tax=Nocardia acididurans TaxID=2802282 RepID=A0ABS1MGV9_9NOCA|nr:type VII secretion integral membrane protein EccD [Nocardia acididurans]MBL1079781.1 type VII secretion integral membrane protein EccD [Nocardia acididurans]
MTASTATRTDTDPTADPARSAEVDTARVAVLAASYQVDVVLPTTFTIETFIDDLVTVLTEAIDDDTVDFTPEHGQWSLARPGDHPMPRWRCLADHDIADGAVLALTTVDSPEVFTPVVEDITDALAVINDREFAEFDPPTATIVGSYILATTAFAITALLTWDWTRSGSILTGALPALLLGALAWGAAVAARRRFRSPRVALALTLTALPLLFSGTAMLVPTAYGHPGPFGPANLTTGSVIVVLAAIGANRLTGTATAALTALTVLGLVLSTVSMVLALTTIAPRQVFAGTMVAGLILLTLAPRLAMALARIRPPDLPDPGNAVSPATLNDLFETETARGTADPDDDHDPDRAAVDFETRARLAVLHLRGLIVAVAVLLTGSAIVCAAASPGGIREILVTLAIAGILAMRARWYPDRVQAIALLTAATSTVLGLSAVLVCAYTTAQGRILVLGCLAIAAAVAAFAAASLPGRRLSPVTRRVIDLIEYALIVAVPVLAFWIMGLYTAMRRI